MTSGTTAAGAPARVRRRRHRSLGAPIPRRTYLAIAVASFVVLLGLWGLITASGAVNPLFLPSPAKVLDRLVTQAQNGQLWADTSVSVYRIMVGFLLASVMSIPLGIVMGTTARVEAAVQPVVDFVRYMPVVAFVPLTILWVGIDDAQKFLIIWMGTFFQQVLMVSDAVRQTPRSLIELGETLGLGNAQILTRIVLPASAPRLWDMLRITLGWAWTWLVVAELVAATTGLGYRITLAQRYLSTDIIIAYVLVLGLLGLVSDQVMRALGRRLFRYERLRR